MPAIRLCLSIECARMLFSNLNTLSKGIVIAMGEGEEKTFQRLVFVEESWGCLLTKAVNYDDGDD